MSEQFSKRFVTLIGYLYQLLCFVGLIWQLQEISVNYFKFETVSSINIKMPGDEKAKAINVCFIGSEILNIDKYLDSCYRFIDKENRKRRQKVIFTKSELESGKRYNYFFLAWLTISDRFSISLPPDEVFSYSNTTRYGNKTFILHQYFCYHIFVEDVPYFHWNYDDFGNKDEDRNGKYDAILRNFSSRKYGFKNESEDGGKDSVYFLDLITRMNNKDTLVKNVTKFYALLSPVGKLPWLEFYLTPRIDIEKLNSTLDVILSASSYITESLERPYVDNCYDYTQKGFKDRNDAINSCINDRMINGRYHNSYWMKLFTGGIDYSSAKNIEKGYRIECTWRYGEKDCFSETLFTKITTQMEVKTSEKRIKFHVDSTNEPSFEIRSSPKIAFIDYACYVLGACGTWFGFCFLMLNPSPYLLERFESKKKNLYSDPSTIISDVSDFKSQIKSDQNILKSKMHELERIQNKMLETIF